MNQDHLRTEEFMTMEALDLVAHMVHNNRRRPFSVSFSVGNKLNDYRRLFLAAIEKRRLILFKDTAGMISFGYSAHAKPCTITFLPSA